MSLRFRWLGVAGLELRFDQFTLAVDPFFTRPSLLGLIKPVIPDAALLIEKLPVCDAVLVTHSHWDHLMDVPSVLQHTGAAAYGSPNACTLLKLHGIPGSQVMEVCPGDRMTIGPIEVEVVPGQHSSIPFGWVFNGKLRSGIKPPLRMQDYRMDFCLGYLIHGCGTRVLVCAARPQATDVLFIVAQESRQYYLDMISRARPHTIVPIHWDNFIRPLSKPIRGFTRPGRMGLGKIQHLAQTTLPEAKEIVPEWFVEYTL